MGTSTVSTNTEQGSSSAAPPGRRLQLPVIAAFFAIYVIWGSTFLAIRIAVLLAPPWLCAGIRFFTAGSLLYAFMRLKGVKAPTWQEWRTLAIIGGLMFAVTYGALFWAEQFVPSGITAVLESTIPLLTVVLEVFVLRQQRFRWQTLVALPIGFLGVAVMMLHGSRTSFRLLPCLVILGASTAWSLGAVLTRSMKLPASRPLAAGAEMMLGGVVLLAGSFFSGEMHPFPHFSTRAVLALVYLITAGSLVGFSAFVYLLGRMPASRVASHAYVNPVVAIALGYFVAAEPITLRTLLGAALVICSVIFTMRDSST
jgi:drug/metabolite transporter (DMT)-like permease